jgi:hypothetical protein
MKVIISEQHGEKELLFFDEITSVHIRLPLSSQEMHPENRVTEYNFGTDEVDEDTIIQFSVQIIKALMEMKKHKFEGSMEYIIKKVKEF